MGATDEETQLILATRNGDPAAIESLIRKHQKMVDALAYRMTGSLADAEDLAQEAFIQALQQIEHFRGESAFSSWLYRIAMNKCLNWRKRERRRGELHEEWSRTQLSQSEPENRRSAEVQSALMKLHPKQRAAIVLTVHQELSHAEAARVLGCSETTVSWRIFSAKKKLRRWLSKEPTIHD